MDTVNELEPRPCGACFQRDGKSENIIPVSLVQAHSQYRLRLLEIENVKDRKTAAVYASGMQAMLAARYLSGKGAGKVKIVKDRMLVWQEKKT